MCVFVCLCVFVWVCVYVFVFVCVCVCVCVCVYVFVCECRVCVCKSVCSFVRMQYSFSLIRCVLAPTQMKQQLVSLFVPRICESLWSHQTKSCLARWNAGQYISSERCIIFVMPWDPQGLKAGGGCGVSASEYFDWEAPWKDLPSSPKFDQISQFGWCSYGGD